MIYTLDKAEYEKVRPQFRGAGISPDQCRRARREQPRAGLVDDPARPQSVFMFSPEGCYLAGNSGNDTFNRALNEALHGQQLLGGPMETLYFICASESWEKQLAVVLHPHRADPDTTATLHMPQVEIRLASQHPGWLCRAPY